MLKIIILLIVIIIALWYVYSNFLVPDLSTFKEKKFDAYYSLDENKVESENYKIRKLDIEMYEIESIQYDKITSIRRRI
ncbi:MAG TPA: hypothetical protein DEO36_07020 [Flavobacteriaceae bacterium]|jgi:hypothetical protein|nr:hypothetical protein [Flavobacteriaceae bacterium]